MAVLRKTVRGRFSISRLIFQGARGLYAILISLESSNQTQRFRAVNLVRRPVAQAFARPAVELIVRLLHALLAHARQRFAFRKVLAQEAVGVLVGAALPRMVRKREVELDVDVGRDLGMVRELLAAVEHDGPQRLPLQGPRHLPAHAFGGLEPAFAADQEAVLAVDVRQQAGAAGLARDRVALPVARLAAPLGGGRDRGMRTNSWTESVRLEVRECQATGVLASI